jgi:hypothetical protein
MHFQYLIVLFFLVRVPPYEKNGLKYFFVETWQFIHNLYKFSAFFFVTGPIRYNYEQKVQENNCWTFFIYFQNFYFYDQISLFVLFNTFLRVENAFFIIDFYFRSLKFELKGYSTRVRSKKSLFFESIQK